MITGVGVDVLSVDRVGRLLAEDPLGSFPRLFSPREIETAQADPRPPVAFTGLLAAKGAFFRALRVPCGAHSYREVEVLPDGAGHRVVLRGVAAEVAARRGLHVFHVTLTRTVPWTAAVVVLAAREELPEACRA